MEISFVQSVLLRDVGLISSGLKLDHAILQRERSLITNLCRCLSTHAGAPDNEEYAVNQKMDHGWLPWLLAEEVVRLMHCVYSKGEKPNRYSITNVSNSVRMFPVDSVRPASTLQTHRLRSTFALWGCYLEMPH
jgi:hypothetical protein